MGIALKPYILIIYLNVFCMKIFTQDGIKFYSIFPGLRVDTTVVTALSEWFKNTYTWEFIGLSAIEHY